MRGDRGFLRLPHTADEAFEAWAPTFGEACAQAALAMFDVMGAPATLVPGPPADVRVEGADRGDLVVRFLSRLLVDFEVAGRFVTGASCVACDGASGTFRTEGGTVDRRAERGLAEVKAVTYHRLAVEDAPGRTTVRVVLDL